MKQLIFISVMMCWMIQISATEYYVSPKGNDKNTGTVDSPFATLAKAQSMVQPGDTVYLRGGIYKPTTSQIMGTQIDIYACVFLMDKSGKSKKERICYFGYPGERPVFDLSEVKPTNKRVSVFYVSGSYLHFKNIEVIGTQVTITGHTQSECFSNRGGSYNIYENLSMHDGMAIGFYLTKGSDNLILNCDAYNNFDNVSEKKNGENVDGFGAHTDRNSTGNIFRGCRAWWNSDDGFDLINAFQSVTIENCWAFYNGYQPGSTTLNGANGAGFKAGGYGMSDNPKVPENIPVHVVKNCISYYNKANGFYSNHHLGGIRWYNNSAYKNAVNFCMLNRKSANEAVDIDGIEHTLINNLSYEPRTTEAHITKINYSLCKLENNSFYPDKLTFTNDSFNSLDASQLSLPRKKDGSLPDITFLTPKSDHIAHKSAMGWSFTDNTLNEKEESMGWISLAGINVDGNIARIEGPDATLFNKFWINGVNVNMNNLAVDLSKYSGTLHLKATSDNGGTIELIYKKE